MRVFIADKFEQSGREALSAAGLDVIFSPGLKDDALAAEVARTQPDVLVVRGTKVPEAVLGAASSLKLIVRAGAGYNTIDVAAASRRGIFVSNCPGKNSIAVAELAFGLICSLDRRIPDNVASLRAGKWNKSEFSKARGLYGRTLGLIGVGQIGAEMIPRARGFGMPVVAWSRSLTPEKAETLGVERKGFPLEVAAAADIVSVHVALNNTTRGMIGPAFFDMMRPGSIFVNTSRGEVVDQAALTKAVQERAIRAGLDVFAGEPAGGTADFTDPIAQEPNVYGTHHIGASTDQAQEAIAAETVRIIRSFAETGKVPNVVNVAHATPVKCTLMLRHLNRPGVLAAALDPLSNLKINVLDMENTIFDGADAAIARIQLESEPPGTLLQELRRNSNVLEVGLIAL